METGRSGNGDMVGIGTEEPNPQVLVVMYHYVHDRDPLTCAGVPGTRERLCGLTVADFSAQLDRLCGALEPIDWPTLYAWMQGRGTIPPRSFLLTFDDGLADHAKTVVPILDDLGLRGVFFVPGAVLTGHRMLSAHTIHVLLSILGEEMFEEELRSHIVANGGDEEWFATLDQRSADESDPALAMYHYESHNRARLKYVLTMGLPIDVRVSALEALFKRHVGSSARWARHWYLGWDDLVGMQSRGHTIGGHGFGHEPYSRLSATETRQDIRRIAAVLREGLGSDLRPFSYPYGSVSDEATAACREVGFVHAFTTDARRASREADPMRLPRIDTIHVDATIRQKNLAWSPA